MLVGNWEMLSRLHTFDDARVFYDNLLNLFEVSPDNFLRVEDF